MLIRGNYASKNENVQDEEITTIKPSTTTRPTSSATATTKTTVRITTRPPTTTYTTTQAAAVTTPPTLEASRSSNYVTYRSRFNFKPTTEAISTTAKVTPTSEVISTTTKDTPIKINKVKANPRPSSYYYNSVFSNDMKSLNEETQYSNNQEIILHGFILDAQIAQLSNEEGISSQNDAKPDGYPDQSKSSDSENIPDEEIPVTIDSSKSLEGSTTNIADTVEEDTNSSSNYSEAKNNVESNSSNVNSTIVVKYNNSNDNVESSDNEGKVNTEENVDTKGSFSSELISENDILPEYVGKPNRQKYETEVKTNANADHIYQGSML